MIRRKGKVTLGIVNNNGNKALISYPVACDYHPDDIEVLEVY